jgi:hypothetical protein
LNGAGGVNAVLTLISESIFMISTNNIAHAFTPQIVNVKPNGTELEATMKYTDATYSMSAPEPATLYKEFLTTRPAIMPSTPNELLRLPGAKPTQVVLTMRTSNENLSPVVVTSEIPKMSVRGYLINNQTALETIEATEASGTVDSLNVSVPGAGYTTATAVISPPNISIADGGVQATASVVVGGGVVTGLTVVNPGKGYLKAPTVTISGTNTTPALGNVVLTPFNSELLPIGGSALSRYLTKSFTLSEISKGAQVIVTASSTLETSFEVYIRTSLTSQGVIHENQEWKQLACDTPRNKSRTSTEYLDYTFVLNNIPDFDVYSLKIVLRSTNRAIVPTISNYSCIILAT